MKQTVYVALLFTLFLLSLATTVTDASHYKFSRDVGKVIGTSKIDSVSKVIHSDDGSIYIIGQVWTTFHDLEGPFITKIHRNGSVAWTLLFGNSSTSLESWRGTYSDPYVYLTLYFVNNDNNQRYGGLLVIDKDGNIVDFIDVNFSTGDKIYGVGLGSVYIMGNAIYLSGQTSIDYKKHIVIAKINKDDLSTIWVKCITSNDIHYPSILHSLYPTNDAVYVLIRGSDELYLIKLSQTDGNIIWVKKINVPMDGLYDILTSSLVANDTSIYVSTTIGDVGSPLMGWSYTNDNNNNASTYAVSRPIIPDTIGYVIKISSDGSLVWAKQLDLTNDKDNIYDLYINGSRLYVGSYVEGKGHVFVLNPDGEIIDDWIILNLPGISAENIIPDTAQWSAGGCRKKNQDINTYVVYSKIAWVHGNMYNAFVDVTSSFSVENITINNINGDIIAVHLPVNIIPVTRNPTDITAEPIIVALDIGVKQTNMSSPVATLNITRKSDSTTIDSTTINITPTDTSIHEIDYGWIFTVANTSVIYSPVEISSYSVQGNVLTLTLSSKANVTIASVQGSIEKILVDGVPVCSSVSECEALRDTDNVIVLDPTNITIYYTSPILGVSGKSPSNNVLFEGAGVGAGKGLGGEVINTYNIYGVIIFALVAIAISIPMYVSKKI